MSERRELDELARRARIVFLAAEGLENKTIAAELGAAPDTVGVWRRRLMCPTLGETVVLETDLGAGLHPALVDPNQFEKLS